MENVTIMPLTDVEKSVKRAVCFMFGIFGHHQISGRKDMKKLFSFVALLFVFALFQISPSQGQNQEPKELTEARNSYNAELQKAIKPVNDRYLPKLEELKKQLTFKGDIKGAVAVEDVITNMSGSQPIQQEGDKDPQELKEIKKNYMVELETAIKPVRSLYLAKLEVLKQQLALSGALKAALAVEEEMEKIKRETLISKSISVVSGSFGTNCGASYGNVTSHLASSCNGKKSCTYTVNFRIIGDPCRGNKSYIAEWRCGGNSTIYRAQAFEMRVEPYTATINLTCND